MIWKAGIHAIQFTNVGQWFTAFARTAMYKKNACPPCKHYSKTCNKKRALVFLTTGFEEVECLTVVDALRRGEVEVIIAGLEGTKATCGANKVQVVPDVDACKAEGEFDALILPGGMPCSQTLADSEHVGKLLKKQEEKCKIIAAICAAPIALKAHCIGKGKSLTSYPAVEKEMVDSGLYKYKCDDVVVDGNLITSRGPATAMKFAFAILKALTDDAKAKEVADAMLFK